MLVLFETPAGYAIFKLLDENKLAQSENLYLDFETPESASKIIKLKYFHKFEDTAEALVASTAAIEGKLSKSLKKTLKNCCSDMHEELAVADAKLGNAIKNKLQLSCVNNTAIHELLRCIRHQADSLLTQVSKKEMTAMALGLAHSLSRYKLKFSPDKVDIMVIQAVCLLDELDKQLNNYIMKAREWYGWHFPELGKIIKDNLTYIKTMHTMGQRENSVNCDLSDIMDETLEVQVKEAAQTSMGSEISQEDVLHVQCLCVEIIELSNYRTYLAEYLTNRMMALSPNLTVLVGDLVGARLIAKAGSLTNLAKQPASTLQILGAEKALFRALKSKKNTPKYGLIYHAQLVGQSSNKNKGKISRMLAAKAALATRVDALADTTDYDLGIAHRAKLEQQLRYLEEATQHRVSGTARAQSTFERYRSTNENVQYPTSADSTLPDKKRLIEEVVKNENDDEQPKKKKKKHDTDVEQTEVKVEVKVEPEMSKKKKKKEGKKGMEEIGESSEMQEVQTTETETSKKKKKKRSVDIKTEDTGESSNAQEGLQIKTENVEGESKKKKKRSMEVKELEGAGEASDIQAQAEADSDIVPKKKKKKKKQESDEAEESVKVEDTTLEADLSYGTETSEGQKKKKKKKKEKETQEAQEPSVSASTEEETVASEKKKKKKKKSKSDD